MNPALPNLSMSASNPFARGFLQDAQIAPRRDAPADVAGGVAEEGR